jgi:DNA-directed RNA polymerase subunit P
MSEPIQENPPEEKPESFNVIYSCMRCGTNVTQSELTRLPEIKCICGFRVFTKIRPPVVKTIKAF